MNSVFRLVCVRLDRGVGEFAEDQRRQNTSSPKKSSAPEFLETFHGPIASNWTTHNLYPSQKSISGWLAAWEGHRSRPSSGRQESRRFLLRTRVYVAGNQRGDRHGEAAPRVAGGATDVARFRRPKLLCGDTGCTL